LRFNVEWSILKLKNEQVLNELLVAASFSGVPGVFQNRTEVRVQFQRSARPSRNDVCERPESVGLGENNTNRIEGANCRGIGFSGLVDLAMHQVGKHRNFETNKSIGSHASAARSKSIFPGHH